MKENFEENRNSSHETMQFLTFTVSEEEYAVDIMTVREIKGWSDTTRLPNSPAFMKGVMNLRGVIIPIFDLRNRFGMGETVPHEKNVVIILAIGDKTIGILVDTVSDILDIDKSEIKPAPMMETNLDDKFVDGIISQEDRMVVLLNVENLFGNEAIEQIQQMIA